MKERLSQLFKQSLGVYALFLVPTILLLAYAGQSDAFISTQIGGTWQAGFWHLLGLSSKVSRVILDILTALSVGGLGWWFYQGWHYLEKVSDADGLTEAGYGRLVLGWTAACSVILLLVVPFHSSDIYGYLNRGFQQSLYHTNPYLTPVAKIPGWEHEPMFHPHWIYNPCPYGFFFAQLVAGITTLCGRHFILAFISFKALNALLLLATTWLILKFGRTLNLRRPWLAAYCFGANPLVLLHVVGNGHNDILMVFLLMVALWVLGQVRKCWLALPLLTLSVLVKYASILALPFVGLYLLKRKNWQALGLGGVVSLLILGSLAAQYIDPHQPWPWADMLDNAGKPQHSLVDLVAYAIYYPLQWFHGPAKEGMATALGLMKPLFWLGFVLFYLRQIWVFARKESSLEQVVSTTGIVMTVMAAFISAKFHPWYTVMFLPLLLLKREESRWRQFGETFSLFQLAGFTIFQNLPVFSPLALTVLPAWLAFRNRSPFKSTAAIEAE